ncbi:hypothetical protein ASG56_07025 [Rhodococcus sp. Leaf7]|nr:hypothetical protein ASG56_07025 [Rhodococcus sp. Leaf7]KQU42791.1 hypothetical protein ASG64_07025 [Rhodococcus sp. Leaf247]
MDVFLQTQVLESSKPLPFIGKVNDEMPGAECHQRCVQTDCYNNAPFTIGTVAQQFNLRQNSSRP